MKKILCFLTIIVLFISTYYFFYKKSYTIITLDINPSIEITINKNKQVKKVVPLNNDAKIVLKESYKGKSLTNTLDSIVKELIKKEIINEVSDVIFYTTGNIKSKIIKQDIINSFNNNDIGVNIINIDTIKKEDRKIAKDYNISISKAAYINQIKKDNKNISIELLTIKPVSELIETKNNGWYCDENSILKGSMCYKEIDRKKAIIDDICPKGYYEYNNICYLVKDSIETDNLTCDDDFDLINKKCRKVETTDKEAIYSCEKGELIKKGDLNPVGDSDNDKYYCVDKSTGKAPVQRCLTINHTMIDGKCADGPKPTINGGCETGDYLVNGGCYTMDNEDQWVCPNGNIYEKSKGTFVDLCPDTFTYLEPSVKGYKCRDDYKLKDNVCVKEEVRDAYYERTCSNGYELIDHDKCIDYSKTIQKEKGYTCKEENTELKGDTCIIYEITEAKK